MLRCSRASRCASWLPCAGLAVTILFAAPETFSQTALQYGACADSTLPAGETHDYEFTGSVGDVTTVRMQDGSNPFTAQPRIRIFDPMGAPHFVRLIQGAQIATGRVAVLD